MEIIAPGAFADYFADVAELLPDEGEPDEKTRKRLEELHAAYGFELDPGSVPDLIERHELEV